MRTFRQILEGYVEDNLGNIAADQWSHQVRRFRIRNISIGTYATGRDSLHAIFSAEKANYIGRVMEFRADTHDTGWWRMTLDKKEPWYHEDWLEPVTKRVSETVDRPLVNELFSSEYVYPVTKTEENKYEKRRLLRYQFVTKDDVVYDILLSISLDERIGRIDFTTQSKDVGFSFIDLINTNDAIKVLNTLKSIIVAHKPEIDKLIISTAPDRLGFYKKLLGYLRVKYEQEDEQTIVANI